MLDQVTDNFYWTSDGGASIKTIVNPVTGVDSFRTVNNPTRVVAVKNITVANIDEWNINEPGPNNTGIVYAKSRRFSKVFVYRVVSETPLTYSDATAAINLLNI
jgi:hypothetical protein